MPLFPISLKLRGRLCVVVGGGVIAESKIESLLAADARLVVIAPEVTEAVAAWARAGQIEWQAQGICRRGFMQCVFGGCRNFFAAGESRSFSAVRGGRNSLQRGG